MNEQRSVRDKIEPVRKERNVGLPVEAAFRLFTQRISRWWPLATHSVGEDRAETCFFEGWVGGRIYEVMKDKMQAEWGRVQVWEPNRRVVFTWYPGRNPDTAQEVTVTFVETPDGTLVTLVHTGWEILGDEALVKRNSYVSGWDYVLGKYTSFAAGED